MHKTFISYRREDSRDICGRLYDWIVMKCARQSIFKDIDNIPLGTNFQASIELALRDCEITLVIIGQRWLTAVDEQGTRRIDNPGDFVRIEVETAFRQHMIVIPILVHGARLPRTDELPASLVGLSTLKAIELRSFDHLFQRDIQQIVAILRNPSGWYPAQYVAKRPGIPHYPLIALGGVGMIVLLAASAVNVVQFPAHGLSAVSIVVAAYVYLHIGNVIAVFVKTAQMRAWGWFWANVLTFGFVSTAIFGVLGPLY